MVDTPISGKTTTNPDRTQDYLSFLSTAMQEISSTLDYETTLKNVAQAMVPQLSDWCAVDLAEPDGSIRRVATAHVNPEKVERALELGRKYPRDPKADSGSTKVLRTGEPEMVNGITDEQIVAAAKNKEHLAMMRDMEFRSLMIVPIKSRGKTLGTMTFVWSNPDKLYTMADLAFAQTLAAMAGSAIDNSRLYQAAQPDSS